MRRRRRFGPPITHQVRPAQRLGRRSNAQVTRRRGFRRTAFGARRRRADDRDPGERPQSTAAQRSAPYRRARSREAFIFRHRRPPLGQIERFRGSAPRACATFPGSLGAKNSAMGLPKDALEGSIVARRRAPGITAAASADGVALGRTRLLKSLSHLSLSH